MRPLRILVFDILAPAIIVGWILYKYPETLDNAIPWIALGVLWHVTLEVLDAEWIKNRLRSFQIGQNKKMTWAIAFVVGGMVSVLYLATIRGGLVALARMHNANASPEKRDEPKKEAIPPPSSNGESHDTTSQPPKVVEHPKAAIKAPPPQEIQPKPSKPDIYAYFVKGTSPGIVLGNNSDIVIRDPVSTIQAWNLTSKISLPTFNQPENGMFIKRGAGILGATLDNSSMKSQIKNGDHILALIVVDCPECIRAKYYWLFVIYGGESWYSPLPDGAMMNIIEVGKRIQESDWDIERFMLSVPHGDKLKPIDMP